VCVCVWLWHKTDTEAMMQHIKEGENVGKKHKHKITNKLK